MIFLYGIIAVCLFVICNEAEKDYQNELKEENKKSEMRMKGLA